MVTGEKTIEFRRPKKTGWIEARLYNKDGSEKKYTHVKFVNGYGADKPYFICKFGGFMQSGGDSRSRKYSNGLVVEVLKGDYLIFLGIITEKGNLKL